MDKGDFASSEKVEQTFKFCKDKITDFRVDERRKVTSWIHCSDLIDCCLLAPRNKTIRQLSRKRQQNTGQGHYQIH